MVHQVGAIGLRGVARDSLDAEHVAVEKEQLDGLRSAQARGVLEHGVEYFPWIVGRAAKRSEDLAARRPLMAGVA
jgi:hypothetical protein